VGVRRHQEILKRRGMIEHDLLQRARSRIELGARIHRPEAGCGGNLVVATAAGMQLGGNVTNLYVQHPVDHGVHVFVRGKGGGSGQKLLTDSSETSLDRFAFLECQDASAPQSDCPSLR
jgi:hypothetical protein